jgi:hypothetical protein
MQGSESQIELFHGYTYSGHPVACAAGIANLDIFREEVLFARAATIADQWQECESAWNKDPVFSSRRYHDVLRSMAFILSCQWLTSFLMNCSNSSGLVTSSTMLSSSAISTISLSRACLTSGTAEFIDDCARPARRYNHFPDRFSIDLPISANVGKSGREARHLADATASGRSRPLICSITAGGEIIPAAT